MKESILQASNVEFVYRPNSENSFPIKALSDITLSIARGQFVVVLGRNGSGKSTFARLLNALLIPTGGIVTVNGVDTKNPDSLWDIRKTVGMVFQNPDNQIIGTVVEEDVAFGPENLGIPPSEIRYRVDEALKSVNIYEYARNAPHLLSGGQKQRVAIAGILAMKPECIVLDEATSMLDPTGRKEVMKTVEKLNREENITVIHITHHMDEAIKADRVIVIDEGEIVFDDTPGKVFSNVQRIKELGLAVPQVAELFHKLRQAGLDLPSDVLDVDKAYEELCRLMDNV